MKPEVICDNCKFEFLLDKLEFEESTVKRSGKMETCIVQYFKCPQCGQKYIVVVYDDRINELNRKYAALMKNHGGMSLAKFKAKGESLKKQIVAEESMLQHLYMKQHGSTLKTL